MLETLLPTWLSHNFFLDWSLKNWRDIYKHQHNLLEIHHNKTAKLLPYVIAFDNTTEHLAAEKIKFQLVPEPFQVQTSPETKKLLLRYKQFSWFHKRKLFNDICLRLVSIQIYHSLENEKHAFLQLQQVYYFDYICTNLCLDAQLTPVKGSLRTRIHIEQNNHQLEALESSKLANVLGINILVFTADGVLILQKRSARTLVRPNQICASASGTLIQSDIPNFNQEFTLKQLLPSFFREMHEEIGLNSSAVLQVDFLGIVRELIRGGQPEILLSAQVKVTRTEVAQAYHQALDQFESKHLLFFDFGLIALEVLDSEDKKNQFLFKFDALLQQYEKEISDPLWANLAMWSRMKLHR
jgi:hypothetical protein